MINNVVPSKPVSSEVLDRIEKAFPHNWSLRDNLLVAALMGSSAHGTYIPPQDPEAIDDIDVMLIVVPPPATTLSARSRFEHWSPKAGTHGELDIVCYSVQKFTALLLKGNPNVMGLLWLPRHTVIHEDKVWTSHWMTQRKIFLSRRVYAAFSGYAYGQLHRMTRPAEKEAYMGAKRREAFKRLHYDAKHAAHCIRLLRMGCELMETGELRVDRQGVDATELIAIKQGEWPLDRIYAETEKGFARMREAESRDGLQDHPNEEAADHLLLQTFARFWRRRAWG